MLTILTSTKHGLSVAAANRNRAIESKARRDKKNRPSQAQFGRLAVICFTRSRRETLREKYERVGSPRLATAQKTRPRFSLKQGRVVETIRLPNLEPERRADCNAQVVMRSVCKIN